MEKTPLILGSCSNATMSLGNKSEALSHLIARVLGQIKSLFLITMSSAWERINSGCPLPSKRNSWSPTRIEKLIFESGFFNFSFNSKGRSAQLDVALTPTMQSPRGVRWDSFVISIVFWWFDLMFLCPENWISNFMIKEDRKLKLNFHGQCIETNSESFLHFGRIFKLRW